MVRRVDKAERMVVGGDYHIGLRLNDGTCDRMQEHTHRGIHELVYCMRGSFAHRLDGQPMIQHEGEVIFVREQDRHALAFEHCHAVNIAFCTDAFEALLDAVDDGSLQTRLLAVETPAVVKLPTLVHQRLSASILMMIQHHNNGVDLLQFKRFLLDALVDVYCRPDRATLSTLPDWLGDALERLQAVPHEELTLERIISSCHRSREHVARSFRRHLNLSPSQWLNERRLDRATELLTTTNRSVTEIAYDVGFESLNYFYQRFKQTYRISPRRFRQQQRSELTGLS